MIDFGQLGDVVLSLPALGALRTHFPQAHISVMTGKVPDQVVRLSALADEVVTVDRVELRDGPKLGSISKIGSFVRDVRRRPFDLVIDLHSLSETNILAFLSRAKFRLLSNRENRSLDRLSNFRPRPPKEDKTKHLTDRYLDVLRPLGITDASREFRFAIPEREAAEIKEKLFAASTRTVGLFPGAGHPSRCWELAKFARLADRLAARELRPLVFLGPEEVGMRSAVEAIFPAATRIIDDLTISQFIAACSYLDAFVTNDTGPMHLAACAASPIVLLLDGRAPATYLPLTDSLAVVRAETIGEIGVEDVYSATMSLILDAGEMTKAVRP